MNERNMNRLESNDPVLQEDLEIVANACANFPNLKDSTVFVTGCTGLLGSFFIKALLCANRTIGLNVTVIGLARSEKKVHDVFRRLIERDSLSFIYGDVCEKLEIDENIDYIIHSASITASSMMVSQPVELIETAVLGTKKMLDLAREKHAKGFIYLSSMEAFGKLVDPKAPTDENTLGYIDLNSVRSCYPESKRMAESLCRCYSAEYSIPVYIARLAQVIGAGVDYSDSRLPAQFARSIIEGQDIILHTHGQSVRNIIYIRDAITAMLSILFDGLSGETYNVANSDTALSVAETAKLLISHIADGKIGLKFDITGTNKYPSDTYYRMITDKLEKCGWKPEVGLLDSYKRMIDSMRFSRSCSK